MALRPGLPLFSLPVSQPETGVEPFEISFTGQTTVEYRNFGSIPSTTLTFSHNGETPVQSVQVGRLGESVDVDVTNPFTLTPTFTLTRDQSTDNTYQFIVVDANGIRSNFTFNIRFIRNTVDRPVFSQRYSQEP